MSLSNLRLLSPLPSVARRPVEREDHASVAEVENNKVLSLSDARTKRGRNVWTTYRQGANSVSIVGRLSTLQSVHIRGSTVYTSMTR